MINTAHGTRRAGAGKSLLLIGTALRQRMAAAAEIKRALDASAP